MKKFGEAIDQTRRDREADRSSFRVAEAQFEGDQGLPAKRRVSAVLGLQTGFLCRPLSRSLGDPDLENGK